jgi:hypothetical protein
MLLLRYAEAKSAIESGNDHMLKAWKGSSIMDDVRRNQRDLAAERKIRWDRVRAGWGKTQP